MKSSAEIRFDFQNARLQADRLDDLADRLERQVADQMADGAQRLHSVWTGDSASRFIAKHDELQQQVRQNIRDLRSIAEEIRRIAKRVYDAEMEALRIVAQRGTASSFTAGGGAGGGGGGGGGR